MATIPAIKREIVIRQYQRGLSCREIAEVLDVSLDAVYYFFRKHNITRRNARESNALQFQKRTASFTVKYPLTKREQQLKIAGVMLYWGEGSKSEREKIVDFTNSNPAMIKTFLQFLRQVCNVNESKFRVLLYCYANQDMNQLMSFWLKVTGISKDQFIKPYIRHDYNHSKQGKMTYGLVHIRYHDKKLLLLLKQWIQDWIDNRKL